MQHTKLLSNIKRKWVKNKKEIFRDIAEIYYFLENENQKVNSLYHEVEVQNIPVFLECVFQLIPKTPETTFAVIDRIVSLKEGALVNVLEKLGIKEEEILKIRFLMFQVTRDFYMQKHEKVLEFICNKNLLTPFLRELLQSIHKIGLVFNSFFENWQRELILGINQELKQKYQNIEEILKALQESMEITENGEVSDRSYSVPVWQDNQYQAVAYAKFFQEDFKRFKKVFENILMQLKGIEENCPEVEQKQYYLNYLEALREALLQEDVSKLLESWRKVDKAWMQITTPLQIGHPLEYYEDHYRKAVAPEWDLRIAKIYQGLDLTNLNHKDELKINKESFLEFYREYTKQMPNSAYKNEIDICVQESLQKTQSYGGQPLLFYGAEINGLFSAQVVPNDESVSAKFGKKIFYFPDRVREILCSKPFMLLSSKTFPKEFLEFNREMLYFRKEDWYKVYEISTIGHEFGHILWVSLDTELKMNQSGQFKNIEEFKATMGGLAYYFVGQNHTLLKELIFNTIARAVGLIAWKKENEVLPYYCEGLIHLDIMFEVGVLRYNGSFEEIALQIDETKIPLLVEKYLQTYNKLIEFYLSKADASGFLFDYVKKDQEGYYQPIREELARFTFDYYEQYNKIGQIADSLKVEEWKKDYLKRKNIANN